MTKQKLEVQDTIQRRRLHPTGAVWDGTGSRMDDLDTSGYCQETSASGEIRLWYWRYHLVLESCMRGGQITSDLGWTHRRWSILQKRTMRC